MPDEAAFIPFIPKAAQVAAENRKEFVRFCREELLVFGPDLDFDAVTWDASEYFRQRGNIARTLLNFTHFGDGKELGSALPEPIAAFAKAYVRYICTQKVRQAAPYKEIDAFRLLAQALSEQGLAADVGLVDIDVLNHAVVLAKTRWGKRTASGRGQKLSEIAIFLRKKD